VEADRVVDPAGAVGADMGDPQRATPAQLPEEAAEGLLISAFGRPDQASAVVIHDHGQVALTLAEGDLIDPDPAQPGELAARLE